MSTRMASQLSDSILTADQLEQVNELATSLDREQAIWVSGFFAGITHRAAVGSDGDAGMWLPAEPELDSRLVTVLFGSETGNSKELATSLAEAATAHGLEPRLVDMADYKLRTAARTSRTCSSSPAPTARATRRRPPSDFFEFLEGRKAPKLPSVRFAVLALGDSTYEHYCAAGKRLDERLEELGAQRLADRVDCDVDYEDAAAAWIAAVVGSSGSRRGAAGSPARQRRRLRGGAQRRRARAGRRSTRSNPFHAPRHRQHRADRPRLDQGDAPRRAVARGLGSDLRAGRRARRRARATTRRSSTRCSSSSGSRPTRRSRSSRARRRLGEALASTLEITAATPRFLEHWAQLTGAAELQALRARGSHASERTAFLRGHHVLDIVSRFPVTGIDAATSSSPACGRCSRGSTRSPRAWRRRRTRRTSPSAPCATMLHDLPRTGVASGYLAARTERRRHGPGLRPEQRPLPPARPTTRRSS